MSSSADNPADTTSRMAETAPRSPAGTEPLSGKAMTHLVMVVCYMLFFATLNTTMFNVAIPDISRQFHLSPTSVSWVLTTYISIFGIGSVIYGKLADSYPVKKLLTAGLVVFNAGSIVGLLAPTFPVLVLGRMLQATGGAAFPALSMLVAVRYIAPSVRGRVLAIVSSTIACGGALGPIFGGFIAGTLNWRYLFLLPVSTLLAIPFYYRLLPYEEPRKEPFDYLGGALLAGLIVSLLLLVVQSRILALPACFLFLAGFVLRINTTTFPFIYPRLILERQFRNGLLTLFLAQGAPIYGMMFTLPILLRNLNHLGTQAIGLAICPGAMTAAVLSFFGGRISDRKGSVMVVRTGLTFLLVGYTLLSFLTGMPTAYVTCGLIISYSGFSIVQSSLAKTVSMILPPDQTGIGMGMYNLTFFTSGALGAAIASRIIETSGSGKGLNPFALPEAAGYSNVFVLIVAMVAWGAAIFSRTFSSALPAASQLSGAPASTGIGATTTDNL